MLSFDEPTHTYRFNGLIIPSVTQVLSMIGGYEGIPKAILDRAADRGTAIHHATELADFGTLDWTTVHEEVEPYLLGWQQFLADKNPELLQIETRVYHPTYRFAGTIDRELILDGARGVLDLKSSIMMMPSVGPQLAAYKEAMNHGRPKGEQVKKRWGLQLKKKADKAGLHYALHEYTDPTDWAVFTSCLTVLNFRKKAKVPTEHFYCFEM